MCANEPAADDRDRYAFRARNICKTLGGNEILRGIDLDVEPGEVVCIVGPSGSGKSTLLRCLNWLSPPDDGEVRMGGELIGLSTATNHRRVKLPDSQIRRQRSRIGMVFQNFNLWPHLTARQNVMEGLVSVQRMRRDEAAKRAEEELSRVGLGNRIDAWPSSLSGGQQQRVAIARALAMRPELMLLDEPTSALDPELVGEVLEVIQSLAAQDITMIIVTHEIQFAADVADTVLFMDEGLVVERGDARQVINGPEHPRSARFFKRFMDTQTVSRQD